MDSCFTIVSAHGHIFLPWARNRLYTVLGSLTTFTFVCVIGCSDAALAGIARPAARHLDYVVSGLVVLQTILIVILLLQNRRHQRARADAAKQYAELTHTARLAVIGEITASVTHEVAQPLGAILNNVETAQYLLKQPEPNLSSVLEILADVREDDLRASSIVSKLRKLLRKRELQFEPVDVDSIASTALTLIAPEAARRHIEIRTTFADDLTQISADPVHLQQVLINLLVNAMDAMTETPFDERVLEMRTEDGGSHINISVIDKGHGISPENMERIFDSFFSTKKKGMGLGLSIARSIVHMHGGKLWGAANPSGGAIFTLGVPKIAAKSNSPSAQLTGNARTTNCTRG